jgi:hypothetical protein
LTEEQIVVSEGRCPYCERKLPAQDISPRTSIDSDADNPYAPPRADLGNQVVSPFVPAGLGGKIAMAGVLLGEQLLLFGAMVFTIWLPGNLLLEMVAEPVLNPADRLASLWQRALVELFFTPIYTAGIITALAWRMEGEKISYRDAMRAGVHHWGRLFGARFVANLFIMLGFLCFLIPGGILAIRFMLIEEVVVLEGAGVHDSRWRSSILTRGQGWSLCLASSFAVALVLLAGLAVGAILELAGVEDLPVVAAAGHSLIYLVSVYSICLLFLYYWEARSQENRRDDANSGERPQPGMRWPGESWRLPQ